VRDKGPTIPFDLVQEVAARTNGEVTLVAGHVYADLLGYEKKGWVRREMHRHEFSTRPISHFTLTDAGRSYLETLEARGR